MGRGYRQAERRGDEHRDRRGQGDAIGADRIHLGDLLADRADEARAEQREAQCDSDGAYRQYPERQRHLAGIGDARLGGGDDGCQRSYCIRHVIRAMGKGHQGGREYQGQREQAGDVLAAVLQIY